MKNLLKKRVQDHYGRASIQPRKKSNSKRKVRYFNFDAMYTMIRRKGEKSGQLNIKPA